MQSLAKAQRYQIEHDLRLGLDNGAIAIGVGFCRRTIECEWVCLYACDPGKPCQKGAAERMNKLIRQYIPKGISLRNMTQAKLDRTAKELNQRPRQQPGWSSPLRYYPS